MHEERNRLETEDLEPKCVHKTPKWTTHFEKKSHLTKLLRAKESPQAANKDRIRCRKIANCERGTTIRKGHKTTIWAKRHEERNQQETGDFKHKCVHKMPKWTMSFNRGNESHLTKKLLRAKESP